MAGQPDGDRRRRRAGKRASWPRNVRFLTFDRALAGGGLSLLPPAPALVPPRPAVLEVHFVFVGVAPGSGSGGARSPGLRDDPGFVRNPGLRGGQRRPQLIEPSALSGARTERQVDRLTELARELAALTAKGRQAHPQPSCLRAAGAGPDGVHAGETLVEDEREREQIGGDARGQPLGLFGCHVRGGADHVPGHRQRVAAEHTGDAEVGQPGHAGLARGPVGNEHVRRLDVAMDHAVGVGMRQRVAQRDPDLDHVAVGQAPLGEEPVERRPLDELGDEIRTLVIDRGLVQRDDPGVREPGRGASLALEPPAYDALAGEDLDRDVAVEPFVAREPHGGEAASPEPAAEAVALEDDRAVRSHPRGPRGVAAHRAGGSPAPRSRSAPAIPSPLPRTALPESHHPRHPRPARPRHPAGASPQP